MVSSAAPTVPQYLASLPPDRRKAMAAVRRVMNAHMPKGYREAMNWGMICWEIPLAKYPDTHNGRPLSYVGLAAQKHHLSLYLVGIHLFPAQAMAVKDAFRDAGKRPHMGKGCIRFKHAEEIPLEAIGELIAEIPPARYILRYEEVNRR